MKLIKEGTKTLNKDVVTRCEKQKSSIDELIKSLAYQQKLLLFKLRNATNLKSIAAQIKAHTIRFSSDISRLINLAIEYGLLDNVSSYEHYDVSDLGISFQKIVQVRFQNDISTCNACNNAITDFMRELNSPCRLSRESLNQGFTQSYITVQNWLTSDISDNPFGEDEDVSTEDQPSSTEITVPSQVEVAPQYEVSPRLKENFIREVDFEKQIIYFKDPIKKSEPLSKFKEMTVPKSSKNKLWNLLVRLLTQVEDDGWVTLEKKESNWQGLFQRTPAGDRRDGEKILDPTQYPVAIGLYIYPDKDRGMLGDTKIRLERDYKKDKFKQIVTAYSKWKETNKKR